ncbi:hypothetical protein HDU93_009361 [Gonapodya sp. JEL0774]|nr:hypothetical protein HDU93_009361 [Gonapodya sp. JEL0774]
MSPVPTAGESDSRTLSSDSSTNTRPFRHPNPHLLRGGKEFSSSTGSKGATAAVAAETDPLTTLPPTPLLPSQSETPPSQSLDTSEFADFTSFVSYTAASTSQVVNPLSLPNPWESTPSSRNASFEVPTAAVWPAVTSVAGGIGVHGAKVELNGVTVPLEFAPTNPSSGFSITTWPDISGLENSASTSNAAQLSLASVLPLPTHPPGPHTPSLSTLTSSSSLPLPLAGHTAKDGPQSLLTSPPTFYIPPRHSSRRSTTRPVPTIPLPQLPPDILLLILSHLPPLASARLAHCSRILYATIATDDVFWRGVCRKVRGVGSALDPWEAGNGGSSATDPWSPISRRANSLSFAMSPTSVSSAALSWQSPTSNTGALTSIFPDPPQTPLNPSYFLLLLLRILLPHPHLGLHLSDRPVTGDLVLVRLVITPTNPSLPLPTVAKPRAPTIWDVPSIECVKVVVGNGVKVPVVQAGQVICGADGLPIFASPGGLLSDMGTDALANPFAVGITPQAGLLQAAASPDSTSNPAQTPPVPALPPRHVRPVTLNLLHPIVRYEPLWSIKWIPAGGVVALQDTPLPTAPPPTEAAATQINSPATPTDEPSRTAADVQLWSTRNNDAGRPDPLLGAVTTSGPFSVSTSSPYQPPRALFSAHDGSVRILCRRPACRVRAESAVASMRAGTAVAQAEDLLGGNVPDGLGAALVGGGASGPGSLRRTGTGAGADAQLSIDAGLCAEIDGFADLFASATMRRGAAIDLYNRNYCASTRHFAIRCPQGCHEYSVDIAPPPVPVAVPAPVSEDGSEDDDDSEEDDDDDEDEDDESGDGAGLERRESRNQRPVDGVEGGRGLFRWFRRGQGSSAAPDAGGQTQAQSQVTSPPAAPALPMDEVHLARERRFGALGTSNPTPSTPSSGRSTPSTAPSAPPAIAISGSFTHEPQVDDVDYGTSRDPRLPMHIREKLRAEERDKERKRGSETSSGWGWFGKKKGSKEGGKTKSPVAVSADAVPTQEAPQSAPPVPEAPAPKLTGGYRLGQTPSDPQGVDRAFAARMRGERRVQRDQRRELDEQLVNSGGVTQAAKSERRGWWWSRGKTQVDGDDSERNGARWKGKGKADTDEESQEDESSDEVEDEEDDDQLDFTPTTSHDEDWVWGDANMADQAAVLSGRSISSSSSAPPPLLAVKSVTLEPTLSTAPPPAAVITAPVKIAPSSGSAVRNTSMENVVIPMLPPPPKPSSSIQTPVPKERITASPAKDGIPALSWSRPSEPKPAIAIKTASSSDEDKNRAELRKSAAAAAAARISKQQPVVGPENPKPHAPGAENAVKLNPAVSMAPQTSTFATFPPPSGLSPDAQLPLTSSAPAVPRVPALPATSTSIPYAPPANVSTPTSVWQPPASALIPTALPNAARPPAHPQTDARPAPTTSSTSSGSSLLIDVEGDGSNSTSSPESKSTVIAFPPRFFRLRVPADAPPPPIARRFARLRANAMQTEPYPRDPPPPGPDSAHWHPCLLSGVWVSTYRRREPAFLYVRAVESGREIWAFKLTGNLNVPRGKLSWRAFVDDDGAPSLSQDGEGDEEDAETPWGLTRGAPINRVVGTPGSSLGVAWINVPGVVRRYMCKKQFAHPGYKEAHFSDGEHNCLRRLMSPLTRSVFLLLVAAGAVMSFTVPSSSIPMLETDVEIARLAGVTEENFYRRLARRDDCPSGSGVKATTVGTNLTCTNPSLPTFAAQFGPMGPDWSALWGGYSCGTLRVVIELVLKVHRPRRACILSNETCGAPRSGRRSTIEEFNWPPKNLRKIVPRDTTCSNLSGAGTGANVGAIAGGVAGGAIALGLVVGLVFIFVIRDRRKKKEQPKHPNPAIAAPLLTTANKDLPNSPPTSGTLNSVAATQPQSTSPQPSASPANGSVNTNSGFSAPPIIFHGPVIVQTTPDGTQHVTPAGGPVQHPVGTDAMGSPVYMAVPGSMMTVGQAGMISQQNLNGGYPLEYKDALNSFYAGPSSVPLSPITTDSGTMYTTSSASLMAGAYGVPPQSGSVSSGSVGSGEMEVNKRMVAANGYNPSQPDEMAVSAGDIILVKWMFADGWMSGVNESKGTGGFFPATVLSDLASVLGPTDLSTSIYSNPGLRTASFRAPMSTAFGSYDSSMLAPGANMTSFMMPSSAGSLQTTEQK